MVILNFQITDGSFLYLLYFTLFLWNNKNQNPGITLICRVWRMKDYPNHKICYHWGTCVAQLVKRLTSVQVMSSVCGFEPSVRLCAGSWEPGACLFLCVCVSLCPSPVHALSLSKIISIEKKIKNLLSLKGHLGGSVG